MGLHTGEPSVGEEGYHGIGLHRGARIAAAAHGGQVLVSSATAELIQDDLPAGVSLRDLGEQQLKDIDRPERLYQLVAEGLPTEFPPRAAPEAAARRSASRCRGSGRSLRRPRSRSSSQRAAARARRPPPPRPSPPTRSASSIPETGRLTGQIPVGASPSAVAAGDGSIWVANVDAHSVSRIDPVKQVVIADDPGRQRPGRDRLRRRLRLGHERPRRHGLEDRPADEQRRRHDRGRKRARRRRGRRRLRLGRELDRRHRDADRPANRQAASGDPGRPERRRGRGRLRLGLGHEPVDGTVTRIDPRSATSSTPIQAGSGADAVAIGARQRLGREQPRRHRHPDRPGNEQRARDDPRRRRPERHRRRRTHRSG